MSVLKRRNNKYNPKRKVRDCTEVDAPFLQKLYAEVIYEGNPQHKKSPGDFGLIPPCDPRAAKSLCDEVCIFKHADALRLLKLGVERGLVSVQINDYGFPQNIWSVTTLENGKEVPLEAQKGNPQDGSYHGYPLQPTDPMYEKVLEKWRASRCLISK